MLISDVTLSIGAGACSSLLGSGGCTVPGRLTVGSLMGITPYVIGTYGSAQPLCVSCWYRMGLMPALGSMWLAKHLCVLISRP